MTKDILTIAKDLIQRNKLKDAIEILESEKNSNSDNSFLFFELGKAYLLNKDFKMSILNLEISLKLKDENWTKVLLAKAFENDSQLKRSLNIFFGLKKSNCRIEENIDEQIILVLMKMKKNLIAYNYTNKYLYDNFDIKNKIIESLFLDLMVRLKSNSINFIKDYINELENITFEFLENNKSAESLKIEEYLTELYLMECSDFFSRKKEFIDYIKKLYQNSKNKRYYNSILNRFEIQNKDIFLFSRPRALAVNLNNLCNIRCKFCVVHKAPKWELPKNVIEEIIDLLPYLEQITWLGGEVFLCKDFKQLFDVVAENQVHQEIVTNGLLLDEDWINKLIISDVTLSISITSIDKSKYELLHEGAKFDTLLSNLKYIKENISKKHDKFQFWIYTLVLEDNYMELENIVVFACKYNFDTVRFQPLVQDKNCENVDNIFDTKYKNLSDVVLNLQKAIKKAKDCGININNILPVNCEYKSNINKRIAKDVKENNNVVENKLFCIHPWTTMVINYGGYVTFDCSCLESVGNIYENNLMAIWNAKNTKKFREKIVKNKYANICNSNCVKYNVQSCY